MLQQRLYICTFIQCPPIFFGGFWERNYSCCKLATTIVHLCFHTMSSHASIKLLDVNVNEQGLEEPSILLISWIYIHVKGWVKGLKLTV